ncbi:MAG: magnesium-translocating P-type ATPase [Acetobacteraceae bacterium]|nr:magnesium-translocating P-type ATPase [Acetobacteraceae bacterium]
MRAPPPSPERAFWSLPAEALLTALGSTATGLSTAEAAARLARYGENSLARREKPEAIRLVWRQVESPLVLILVFGGLVSLVLGDWVDAALILVIVAGSALAGFLQEYRAATAVAALRQRLALETKALRDGAEVSLPAERLVPGDIVLLSAGNLVPADGLVLAARDFLVAEASLTGESFPVEKRPGVVAPEASASSRSNAVFMGASVRSGTATVLVAATGAGTAFGAIAARLREAPEETEFSRGVRAFGAMLLRVMVVMVLFVVAVNQALGRPFPDALLFAVALAVGLSPELLPALINVTLSAGARRLAHRGVLVRRLEAIENFGSMDVLCTDKTGTVTLGTITLADAHDPAGAPSAHVRRLAFLNAALETGIENPLDAALVAMGEAEGLSAAGIRKVDEIPYDFQRRRLAIVIEEPDDPQRHRMIVKGAFAEVLDVCDQVATAVGPAPFTEAERERLGAVFREHGRAGFRVLAVADRLFDARPGYGRDDEAGLVLQGLLLFLDPPKPDAAESLGALAARGIAVKIITGDNRHVAAHVARHVGLDAAALLTGEEIAAMNDEALWHAAPHADLFVEIDPQQKARIVRALQHAGHAVGYLGDGINDAAALHAADVGISVDGAVDVARESADIVLLSPDLDALREGVEEGRRIFANTLKFIAITTAANFGNMVSMAIAAPLLPFLPLLPKQILLNNFLSDLPLMAVSGDSVDPEHGERPQRWSIAEVQRFMLIFGLLSSVFDLLTFGALLWVAAADERTFQTAWFVLSLLTEIVAVLILRTRRPAWRSRPGRLLLWSSLAVAALAPVLPYLGGMSAVFGFVPLAWSLQLLIVAVLAAYVAANEGAKHFFWARRD